MSMIQLASPLREQLESTQRNYCDKNKLAELVLVR